MKVKQKMVDLPYPKVGDKVRVVQKKDYETGKLTEGVVKEILTKKRHHPRGIKVQLTNGIIGRIQEFVDQPQSSTEEKIDLSYIEDPGALI